MKTFLAIFGSVIFGLSVGFAQPEVKQPARSFPAPPGVKVLRNLEYGRGGDRAMLLDLYLPEKSEKKLPLIIWIHGGAWMAGSKDGPSPALRFTAEGYAVAQVGYRLSQEAKFRLKFTIAKLPCAGCVPMPSSTVWTLTGL